MLFKEIMKIGKPRDIYSTPVTKTPDNKDMKVGVPVHLAGFPEDYWVKFKKGEAVAGFTNTKMELTPSTSPTTMLSPFRR